MPRVVFLVVALLALIAPQLVFGPIASSQDAESVATAAKPSVAALIAERPDGIFSGTGFMAADQLVLTAYHIVEGARRILLKFPDYPPVEARFVGSNRNDDIAVLSIPGLPVRPLTLGDISQIREGQTIIVVGFPRIEALGARTPTVTQGIISAVRPGLLQMQAPVSPGNSGGPVLTLRGDVVGVVSSTLRGEQQGINFATPINAAKSLLGQAILAPPGSQPPTSVGNVPSNAPSTLPSVSVSTTTDPYSIVPGQGIGAIRLGMHVEEVARLIGTHKGTKVWPDGSVSYYWYVPPANNGIGVRATRTGTIYRVTALNDARYVTVEKLHDGSTESEVRAVLGQPSRVVEDGEGKTKTLEYAKTGVWFGIQLNPRYTFYNAVFGITVVQPE